MNKKLTTRQEYDETKAMVEALIAEATEKGMLEPEMDNDYTRQISELSKQMAQYEDEFMDILPLREKSPLIRSIEEYFYARNMKQKEGAKYLGINESVFSQILSGKRRITMPIAKRLHSKLGINAEMILEFA
jgi:antitoxin component HigA of HigAB toxin-antitoxin module